MGSSFSRAVLLTLLISLLSAVVPAAGDHAGPNAAELRLAIQRLGVTGSALYLAAHPDDENTALLAWLHSERGVRTAYLSLNRGSGGQNLLGGEQGEALGLLRTAESLAARRVDGAEQFFTRAIDFGYSKSADETLALWGQHELLGDVVRVVRTFRPDVIITRFPGDGRGGHGHHTASVILAREAFHAANDPSAFPEQLKDGLTPWQPVRLLWNNWRPEEEEKARLIAVDLGAFNPLLGRSYMEIAAESRSMHKCQGFGMPALRGTRLDHLEHLEGDQAKKDLFEGIGLGWSRVAGGEEVGRLFQQTLEAYNPRHPASVVPLLVQAHRLLDSLEPSPLVSAKLVELERVIRGCAGLWLEITANRAHGSPGEEVKLTATALARGGIPVTLDTVALPLEEEPRRPEIGLEQNVPCTIEALIRLPADAEPNVPYWLRRPAAGALHQVPEPSLIGEAQTPPPLIARFTVTLAGLKLVCEEEVRHRWTDPVAGERDCRFLVSPPVVLSLRQPVVLFANSEPREVTVTVRAMAASAEGTVRLRLPAGWRSDPMANAFTLDNEGQERVISFRVTPPSPGSTGRLTAFAMVGGRTWDHSMTVIDYPHIPRQTLFQPAEAKLLSPGIDVNCDTVGYVMGPGDAVPEALERLGCQVTLLSDEDLEQGDLDRFDTIVIGIRAYNTRDRLAQLNLRLIRYVERGGTVVVQYSTAHDRVLEQFGPFPLTAARGRVTREEAPVRIIAEGHPLLSRPNRIGEDDFDGWVQERGLYFPEAWDQRYDVLLSTHDPDEPELRGGLLHARHRQGVWILCSLSLFRQLPAGVPGAYRLLANLVSAGHDTEDDP